MSKFMRIGLIAGGIVLANVIYASRNPLASDPPCGDICNGASECSGSCKICFVNPILFPATCIAQ